MAINRRRTPAVAKRLAKQKQAEAEAQAVAETAEGVELSAAEMLALFADTLEQHQKQIEELSELTATNASVLAELVAASKEDNE